MEQFKTFEDFWPYYVAQHSLASTRALHFAGTTMVLGALVATVLYSLWWLPAAFALGYGPAWIGHFFFEKNRPATFTHPLWSLRGDFRMWCRMLRGRMAPEVDRAVRTYPRPG
jgi:hypothetical protein